MRSNWFNMDQRLDINLTPLLDLVLQLIMFFMLTVSFVRVDRNSDGVDLPVAQSAMPLSTSPDNVVYLTIDQLGERLGGGAQAGNDRKVSRAPSDAQG